MVFRLLKKLVTRGSDRTVAAAPLAYKQLPSPDSAQAYSDILGVVLAQHDAHAQAQIKGTLAHMLDTAEELHFGVHPDQDGEGSFGVMIHVIGPDSYAQNKAVAEFRSLFDIKRIEGGLNVAVPLFDPDEVDFEVNDVVADAAMQWVARLWITAGQSHPDVPVLAFCADDWGNPPALWLQGAPE